MAKKDIELVAQTETNGRMAQQRRISAQCYKPFFVGISDGQKFRQKLRRLLKAKFAILSVVFHLKWEGFA